MPCAASRTSSGTRVETGDDVPHEDQQRVADERDQRGRARQSGDRDEDAEQRQRRDRVQQARCPQHRRVEPPPAPHHDRRAGSTSMRPSSTREHREHDVLEECGADLGQVIADPLPGDPLIAKIRGHERHTRRCYRRARVRSVVVVDDPTRVGQQAVPRRHGRRARALARHADRRGRGARSVRRAAARRRCCG